MEFVTNKILGVDAPEAQAQVAQANNDVNEINAPQEVSAPRTTVTTQDGETLANNRADVNYLKHRFKTGMKWLDDKIEADTVTDADALAYEYLTGGRKLWEHLRNDRAQDLAIQQRLDSNTSKNQAESGISETISALNTIATFQPFLNQGGLKNTLSRTLHSVTRGLTPISSANEEFGLRHDTLLKQIVNLTNSGRARGLSVQEIQDFQKRYGSGMIRSNRQLRGQMKYGLELGIKRLEHEFNEVRKHGGAPTKTQQQTLEAFQRLLNQL